MRHLLIECWITEATNTLSEYVILVAFPRQQWTQTHLSIMYYVLCTLPIFVLTTPSLLQRQHSLCSSQQEGQLSEELLRLWQLRRDYLFSEAGCASCQLTFWWVPATLSLGLKREFHAMDHSCHLVMRLRKNGAVCPLPYMPSYHAQGSLYFSSPPLILTFRHRASCVLGQAFHYSPEKAFYIFNQQIYFII